MTTKEQHIFRMKVYIKELETRLKLTVRPKKRREIKELIRSVKKNLENYIQYS
jgi:hypothetical protein